MEKLLSDSEKKELNKFVKLELTASHVYHHLATRMKTLGYFGAEKFFSAEAANEVTHFQKLIQFANNLGAELDIPSLDAATSGVKTIQEALSMAYEMESDLLTAYESSADSTSITLKVRLLLQDYVNHQVESVGEYADLLVRCNIATDMLLFDQELAK